VRVEHYKPSGVQCSELGRRETMRMIDLQLFAEERDSKEPNSPEEEATSGDEEGGSEETGEGKHVTLEEAKKMLQSEADKIRTEYSKKLKEERSERERLENEKLSAEEKLALEEERRRKALEEKEQELTSKELKLRSFEVMESHEIPRALQPILLEGVDSEDGLTQRADLLSKTFSEAVQTAVDEQMSEYGRKPASGDSSGKDPSSMTMEEYAAHWEAQREKKTSL